MLVLLLATTPVAPAGSMPKYRLVDLTDATGETWGGANDVNDFGQVIGWTSSGFVIWHQTGDEWTVTYLEMYVPFCFFIDYVFAINNEGSIIGSMACDLLFHAAILWDEEGVGTVINYTYTGFPRDINDLGQVVGNDPRAWLWENGVIESVDPTGWAWGINDRSEVVGRNSDNHAALWIRDAQGVWQMSDLGTLGIGATALDINNHGQIVGGFSIDSETSHPFLWQDGTMLDLGILPNFDFSAADDINESGQAVGTAATADYSEWRGFLWQQDTMWDLNDIVVSGPSLEIRGARGINESAQIAGWARTPDARLHAILLNPISPGDVDFDGDVDDWDFLELLVSWGDCPCCDTCPADINGDCLVGINDLLILLGNWAP